MLNKMVKMALKIIAGTIFIGLTLITLSIFNPTAKSTIEPTADSWTMHSLVKIGLITKANILSNPS